jgi:hypothetical protein
MMFMSPMTGWRRQKAVSKEPDTEQDSKSPAEPKAEETEMAATAAKAARQMRHLEDTTGTPVVGILRGGRMAKMMGLKTDAFYEAAYREGIGIYPSVARAARTVAQILEWRKYREGLPDIL